MVINKSIKKCKKKEKFLISAFERALSSKSSNSELEAQDLSF